MSLVCGYFLSLAKVGLVAYASVGQSFTGFNSRTRELKTSNETSFFGSKRALIVFTLMYSKVPYYDVQFSTPYLLCAIVVREWTALGLRCLSRSIIDIIIIIIIIDMNWTCPLDPCL